MNALEKIKEVIAYKQLTPNKFAIKIGYNQSNLSKILNGKREPNANLYDLIVSSFPDINRSWFFRDDVEMLVYVIGNSLKVLHVLLQETPIEELSRLLGHATTQELEDVLNGKRNFEPYEIDKLSKAFPNIRKEWIETGEGEMYEETDLAAPKTGIRYYRHVSALMGTDETEGCPSEDFEYLNIPDHVDCKYAINAEGDSMLPLFKNGDVIFVNDWNESYIEWGRVYLVVTSGGNRLIKRLFPSDKEGCVTCRSENTFYPDFEVELAHTRLFLVKGAMAIKPL